MRSFHASVKETPREQKVQRRSVDEVRFVLMNLPASHTDELVHTNFV